MDLRNQGLGYSGEACHWNMQACVFPSLSLSLSPCRPQPPIPFLSLPSNLKLNQLVFVASSVVVIVVIFVVGLFFSFFSFHFVGLSAV